MEVFIGLENLPVFKKPVITIGTFDGVHLGHAKIIERVRKKAADIQGESIIITFEPHPRLVLSKQTSSIELLNSLDEKIQALQRMQIDYLVVVNFTKAFSEISANEYIEDFLINHFHPHTFIIGYDHHFGKGRTGNYQLLESMKSIYNFELEEIPMQELEHIAISSTKIREALRAGEIIKANELLGKNYSLEGKVIHGEKKGRLIGFPTANILVEEKHKLIPAKGVYAVTVLMNEQPFKGMMNIGFRPTVSVSNQLSLEVHIFDFDKDIYDQQIRIEFTGRLRDEKKFNSIDELIQQLNEDKKEEGFEIGISCWMSMLTIYH